MDITLLLTYLVPALLVLGIVAAVVSGLRIVPAERQLVVFRLGALAGVRNAGRTWLVPLLDHGVEVDMRVQTRTVSHLELLLRDRTKVAAQIAYTFRVTDAAANVMQVAQPIEALEQLMRTTMQTLAAHQTQGDFWSARTELETEMVARTREAAGHWGMEVTRIVVGEAA